MSWTYADLATYDLLTTYGALEESETPTTVGSITAALAATASMRATTTAAATITPRTAARATITPA